MVVFTVTVATVVFTVAKEVVPVIVAVAVGTEMKQEQRLLMYGVL